MPREVLVHLNVTVPDGDDRTAEQVGDSIEAALRDAAEAGLGPGSTGGLIIVAPLAEEI